MTDYPEVLFSPEPLWMAADSVPIQAFGGTNPQGFCPHHCIPGMPLQAFARSSDSRPWGQ